MLKPKKIHVTNKLKASSSVEKLSEGKVSLVYLDPDTDKAPTAKVLLQKNDYHLAIKAHDLGKTVKVIGRLSGQKSKTIEYSRFELL